MYSTCVKDAEDGIARQLLYANEYVFKQKGLMMRFRKRCSTSWV